MGGVSFLPANTGLAFLITRKDTPPFSFPGSTTSGHISVRIYEDLKTDGDPFATASLSPGADPDGIGRITKPLASISDLRRTPQRIYGSLPHGQGIDILFVPDGFRRDELGAFRRAAEEMMVDMFAEKPAFRRYEDRFNAWAIEIPSPQSGLSIPSEGIERTTAFETYVNEHNALRSPTLGYSAATYLRLRWRMELVVVVVNGRDHRGSAQGNLIRMPIGDRKHHTFAHELGHAIFGLADEYSFEPSCTLRRRLRNRLRPNVDNTANRSRIKWNHLIDNTTPMPTDDASGHRDDIGAFEGAGTCESGWYRPQHTCTMRSSRRSMCDVCRAEMDRVMRSL